MHSLGPYSANLTLPEKAALKSIDEGSFDSGVRSFLKSSFHLIEQVLSHHLEHIEWETLATLKDSEAAEGADDLCQIFWNGEKLTPWGILFLEWEEGVLRENDLTLTVEELNDYLERSTDFYDNLNYEALPQSTRVYEPALDTDQSTVKVSVLHPDLISNEATRHEPLEPTGDIDVDSRSFAAVVDELTAEGAEQLFPESVEYEGPDVLFPETEMPAAEAALDSEAVEAAVEIAVDSDDPETLFPEADDPEALFPASSVQPVPAPEPIPQPLAKEPETRPQPDDDGEELEFLEGQIANPFGQKNRLVVKNNYLGYGKNSEGVMGLCGQLKVSYFEEKELVGRLESTNPLLFLSSKRLSGKKCTITYWLPPVAFPHPAGHIAVRTSKETKTLSLHQLFPRSKTDLLRDRSVVLCLLLPALIGFLYFAFVYMITASGIDAEAQQTFPDLYRQAMLGSQTGDFRSQGLGLYRLRVIPASESLQMIWAAVIFLAPLLSSKFFYYLSHRRKRRYGGLLVAAQLLPTILLLLTWSLQDVVFPLYSHQDFAPLDLRGFLPWSVVMNLFVAVYLFPSVFGVLDRKIQQAEIRFLLPLILTALYGLVMFIIIYGRSWFS